MKKVIIFCDNCGSTEYEDSHAFSEIVIDGVTFDLCRVCYAGIKDPLHGKGRCSSWNTSPDVIDVYIRQGNGIVAVNEAQYQGGQCAR